MDFILLFLRILIPFFLFTFIFAYYFGAWKVYEKAGQPGWTAIIPIYNVVVLLEIVGRPIWFIVALFLPILNILFFIILRIDLAKSFGKNEIYGLGIVFFGFILLPHLAFSDAEYLGPAVGS
jgi:hypothetical protein